MDRSVLRRARPVQPVSDLLPDLRWVLAIVLVMQTSWLWGFSKCSVCTAASAATGSIPIRWLKSRTTPRPAAHKSWDQQSELEIVPPSAEPARRHAC